jgi:hypothetical protein
MENDKLADMLTVALFNGANCQKNQDKIFLDSTSLYVDNKRKELKKELIGKKIKTVHLLGSDGINTLHFTFEDGTNLNISSDFDYEKDNDFLEIDYYI